MIYKCQDNCCEINEQRLRHGYKKATSIKAYALGERKIKRS